jgi:hypothetical protein
MTIERPMFPPRAERLDSFPPQPAITQGLSRRAALAGIASAAALPIAAATPAAAAQTIDADLIDLTARFEPLVNQYYVARERWARSLVAAHAERERDIGDDLGCLSEPDVRQAFSNSCERSGANAACDALHAIFKEMTPLANAINAASVTSIEGLRAKALVAFWEVAPLCAGDTEFSFDDAYPFQQLFTAVAEVCGLKDQMAAAGYNLPDIAIIEAAPDVDDDGEEA